MSSTVVLSEIESDAVSVANVSVRSDTSGVTAELKGDGMAVLLHIGVGRIEPGSIHLHERTGKLIVKTTRSGFLGIFHCCCCRHEFGPGELEPVPRRVYTRRLHRSISVLSGGDMHTKEDLLGRSLSLIRRYPSPDSVDLTFFTASAEEGLRLWAHDRLTVADPKGSFRSNRRIAAALEGKHLSDTEDDKSPVVPRKVVPLVGAREEDGDDSNADNDDDSTDDQTRKLLPVDTPKRKGTTRASSAPSSGSKGTGSAHRRRKDSRHRDPTASEGADDEGSDIAGRGSSARGAVMIPLPPSESKGSFDAASPIEAGSGSSSQQSPVTVLADKEAPPVVPSAEKPRRRRSRRSP